MPKKEADPKGLDRPKTDKGLYIFNFVEIWSSQNLIFQTQLLVNGGIKKFK